MRIGSNKHEHDSQRIGDLNMDEIKVGSVSISSEGHGLFTRLVSSEGKESEDRPFTSIVESFRFAFALGYSKGLRKKKSGSSETIAPRQFVVSDYRVILGETCLEEEISLGALSSEYAEAGFIEMKKVIESGGTVLDLIV